MKWHADPLPPVRGVGNIDEIVWRDKGLRRKVTELRRYAALQVTEGLDGVGLIMVRTLAVTLTAQVITIPITILVTCTPSRCPLSCPLLTAAQVAATQPMKASA